MVNLPIARAHLRSIKRRMWLAQMRLVWINMRIMYLTHINKGRGLT